MTEVEELKRTMASLIETNIALTKMLCGQQTDHDAPKITTLFGKPLAEIAELIDESRPPLIAKERALTLAKMVVNYDEEQALVYLRPAYPELDFLFAAYSDTLYDYEELDRRGKNDDA